MSAPVEPAFVDTNVLVYALERGVGAKNLAARALLEELMLRRTLRLSVQVLQELYVTLTRKSRSPLPAPQAEVHIRDLARWPVQVSDISLVDEAMRLSRESVISYWDAAIVVAAARSGARCIYSEDLNSGQLLLDVAVINPFA